MGTLISIFIWSAVAAGVGLDHWYGIEEAGNIAIFVAWIFAVTGFFGALQDQDSLRKVPVKTRLSSTSLHAMQIIAVLVMLAAGWFWTALAVTVAGLFYYSNLGDARKQAEKE